MTSPARLTGSLLARKGSAGPADGVPDGSLVLSQSIAAWRHRDVAQPGMPASAPLDLATIRAANAGGGGADAGSGSRVSLTVRLDPARHTRLKIFAARRHCTGQEVIVRALDAYLDACGQDCACMRGAKGTCRGK